MALSPNYSCHQAVPYLSLVVCLAERAGRLYLCLFFSILIYQCLVLPIFHPSFKPQVRHMLNLNILISTFVFWPVLPIFRLL